MKINLIIVSSLILFTFGITSCEKVIDFDIPESEPAIVLNGYITLNEVVKINASSSLSYLDGGNPEALNTLSLITLYKNGVFVEDLELVNSEFEDGKYAGSNPVTSPGSYEIRASAPGFESVVVSTYIPETLSDSEVILLNTFEGGGREFEVSFTDPVAEDDYYHMIVASSPDGFGAPYSVEFTSNSEVFFSDGLDFDTEGEIYYYQDAIFPDDLVNGSNVRIKFKVGAQFEPSMQLQLIKCSEDYYLYHKSLLAYQNSGGPFSVPVQVYSNVENGLGVVAGYNIQYLDLED